MPGTEWITFNGERSAKRVRMNIPVSHDHSGCHSHTQSPTPHDNAILILGSPLADLFSHSQAFPFPLLHMFLDSQRCRSAIMPVKNTRKDQSATLVTSFSTLRVKKNLPLGLVELEPTSLRLDRIQWSLLPPRKKSVKARREMSTLSVKHTDYQNDTQSLELHGQSPIVRRSSLQQVRSRQGYS
jgi:hypothetical protein